MSSSPALTRTAGRLGPLGVAAAGGAIMIAALTGYLGSRSYTAAGTAFPGQYDATAYALLRLIAAVAGSFTLGSLAYALFCTRTTARGRVDVDGYAGVRIVERAGIVWALASLALIPVSAADAAGITVGDMMGRGAFADLVAANERPKAWIVTAVLAVAIATLSRAVLSWNGLFGLAALSVLATLAPACVGNAGEGPDHDFTTGAVILFTTSLSVLAGLTWNMAEHQRRDDGVLFEAALHRYRMITALAVTVMAPTAAILAVVLVGPRHFGGVYAVLAAVSSVLLLAHAVLVWWLRRTGPDVVGRTLRWLACVQVFWLAVSVAMAIQPAPAFDGSPFTAQQALLGFDLAHPPNALRLLTMWRFDVVLGTAAIALGVLYVVGVVRLHRRGDEWSRWRSLAWVLGCVGLLIVTSSGVATYGYAMFSVHMTIHMALNMFIPVLLVLGAPVTLLLRAVDPAGKGSLPGPREWVLSLMHSRFTAVLSNALMALAVFVLSLYGLYFSSLFDVLIRYHWGHLLMNIHFLLTGYLFYWAIIGVDPGPRRLPHLGRLGMLFAVMPFHAFFGVAVMSMDNLVGIKFYPQLGLGWLTDLLADQRLGGELAWISGEIPVLLVVGALLSQWAKQDRKVAVRTDRHQEKNYAEDDELAAYNAMLAQLGRTRRVQ